MIAKDAEAFIAIAETADDHNAADCRAAITVLEREINSGRRWGWGVFALVLVAAGGLLLGVGAQSIGEDPALAAVGLGLGLGLTAMGTVLGAAVTRAGRRVLDAYSSWARASSVERTAPSSIVRRLLSGRHLLRSALAAGALILGVFGWSIFGLGLAPSDPLDAGDSQVALAAMGLVWGSAATFACWHLVMGEIRAGHAHAASVR